MLVFVIGFIGGYVMTVGNKMKSEEKKEEGRSKSKKVHETSIEMQGQ